MTGYRIGGMDDRDHERALELAAARPDGFLTAEEDAWLEAHLVLCPSCSAIAAAYASQRSLFAAARHELPVAPRDLWARTAAAIEAESRGSRPGTARTRRRGLAWVYAPLAGVMVVAIVVGASLLNGLPTKNTTKGPDPDATPFQLTADDVQVIARGDDGTLELRRQAVAEVCPTSATSCGLITTPQRVKTDVLAGASAWDAIISPDKGQVVVVERGDGAEGVYVLNVDAAGAVASAAPSIAVGASPAPTGSAAPASAEPTASATATPSASTEPPSASPDPSPSGATGTEAPSEPATEAPSVEATASATAGASLAPESPAPESPAPASPRESASAPASETPSEPVPTPSVEVTPLPNGAVKIASDVIVVGSAAAYAPDGSEFAFSARPADGSAGPDVFVWRVGDARANAVTDDHASQFTGWLDGGLLVSRVVDGRPTALRLSVDGRESATIGDRAVWLPTVGPGARTAAWWDGTIRPDAEGTGWVPAEGRLVVGGWPARGDGSQAVQQLGASGLTDWQVAWDPSGRFLAAWTTTAAAGEPGALSLYPVGGDGTVDVDHPKLDKVPAYAGFSIRDGRLTWSAPADGGDRTVQVLAWKGDTFGRLEILTEDGTTVVR